MISIITPTIRPQGLKLVERALRRQTETDFEWLVVAPKHLEEDIENTIDDYKYIQEPLRSYGDVWSLNHAYNEAIRRARGELIVSWQDWTFADPDVLEKFLYHYEQEPRTLVTGVGNKYSDETWTNKVWQDPRERTDQGSYYGCYFSDIEWNLASCPKRVLFDVGGFDIELDRYFGMDGYSVNERAFLLGDCDFKIDQTIKSYSLEHGRPNKWEELNAIHGPYQERRKTYLVNPILPYLR